MIEIALGKGKILWLIDTRSSLSVHIIKYRIRLIKCYNMKFFLNKIILYLILVSCERENNLQNV